MTVQTQKNTINHLAVEGQDTFSYDFIILDENDVVVLLDGAFYLGGYSVTGLGDDSGSVVLDDPISNVDDGKTLTIARVMDMIQDIDYTAYDGFPAETHERGLDRGILIAQQNAERVESSLRMPLGDDANVFLPPLDDRRETYLYFDSEGNASVIDAIPNGESIISISIADDSKTMMIVDGIDHQRPKIGGNNINGSLGILQLTSSGKIPLANMGVSGIQVIGPFRGDDLCDKPNDEIGDCTEPDTRNPSQRFPDLVPTFPQEGGKFSTGDTFVLTFEEPEIDGTMLLYTDRGVAESLVPVGQRDMILFSSGWDLDGEPTPDFPQGWYYLPKMFEVGDASSTTYSPDGGFILPSSAINVQVAVDHIDKNAVDIQERDQSILGTKTFTNAAPKSNVGPSVGNDLVNMNYVDTEIDTRVDKTGDEMSGRLIVKSDLDQIVSQQAGGTVADLAMYDEFGRRRGQIRSDFASSSLSISYISESGQLLNSLVLGDDGNIQATHALPSIATHLVPKSYADTKLPLSGGSLTGDLLIGNGTSGNAISIRGATTGDYNPYIWLRRTDNSAGGVFFFNNTSAEITYRLYGLNGSSILGTVSLRNDGNLYVNNSLVKTGQDFLRTGTRLDIFNVRTS